MMLVPADFSDVSTEPRAPDPRATMAITAATPITTPSMVRPVRSALRFNARMAIWALTRRKRSMVLRLGAWGLGLGAWGLGLGFYYSWRSASIGSSRAACRAGYQPKNTPTAVAT